MKKIALVVATALIGAAALSPATFAASKQAVHAIGYGRAPSDYRNPSANGG